MSIDEQHRATLQAKASRATAEQLVEQATRDGDDSVSLALAHLLLAIESRLTYGYTSILDGTISCRTCRAIVLETNQEEHEAWHERSACPDPDLHNIL